MLIASLNDAKHFQQSSTRRDEKANKVNMLASEGLTRKRSTSLSTIEESSPKRAKTNTSKSKPEWKDALTIDISNSFKRGFLDRRGVSERKLLSFLFARDRFHSDKQTKASPSNFEDNLSILKRSGIAKRSSSWKACDVELWQWRIYALTQIMKLEETLASTAGKGRYIERVWYTVKKLTGRSAQDNNMLFHGEHMKENVPFEMKHLQVLQEFNQNESNNERGTADPVEYKEESCGANIANIQMTPKFLLEQVSKFQSQKPKETTTQSELLMELFYLILDIQKKQQEHTDKYGELQKQNQALEEQNHALREQVQALQTSFKQLKGKVRRHLERLDHSNPDRRK